MHKPVQFTVRQETQSVQSVIIVRNDLTHEYFSVLPYSGARVQELHLGNGRNTMSVLRKIKNPASSDRDEISIWHHDEKTPFFKQ